MLFQFSRYPQFFTVGDDVTYSSDIGFIYRQLFVNYNANLHQKSEIWKNGVKVLDRQFREADRKTEATESNAEA